jgi:hypothetical protein
MNSIIEAFFFGVIMGIIFGGSLIYTLSTEPLQQEAIKRGYAEMRLPTPLASKADFTWK